MISKYLISFKKSAFLNVTTSKNKNKTPCIIDASENKCFDKNPFIGHGYHPLIKY